MDSSRREEISNLSIDFFLKESASRGFEKSYDFSKMPIIIYEKEKPDDFLVIIESPENDIFYGPTAVIYRDKAFIEIIDNAISEENDLFSPSAPLWYYENSDIEMKPMGLYPGSRYFSTELNSIESSISGSTIDIDMKKYNGPDIFISRNEILKLFNSKGIFYMADRDNVCILMFKEITMGEDLLDRQYRFEIVYNIDKGTVRDVSVIDTTPPPCLC